MPQFPPAAEREARGTGATVAEAIAAALQAAGIREIFSQSVPTQVLLAAEALGLRQIGYRTENAGASMADGFARASGRLGCVASQNGAAAALLAAGLAEALKASIPVLALVQDVPRDHAGRHAFQELDHDTLFAATAKWVGRIDHAGAVGRVMRRAIAAATGGRPGPAVVLIPADVLDEPAGADVAPLPAGTDAFAAQPSSEIVTQAARLLASAQRPLIIAGGGIHTADAHAELGALQERFAIPVATTPMGKGAVGELHPLSFGVIGSAMGPGSPFRDMRKLVRSADVIFFIGTRTNDNGTASWSLIPRDAQLIHCDIDPEETQRNYAALPLIGDARATLRALLAALDKLPASMAPNRRDALANEIAAARAAAAGEAERRSGSESLPLRPERVMRALQAAAPADTLYVADASYSSLWLAQFLVARQAGRHFISPRGLAGIGWGFPLAVGASLGAPGRPVVAIVGDGGFAHCWAELEVAVRHAIPVKCLVFNNALLGFQRHAELGRFGRSSAICDLERIDHTLIAQAVGCKALAVSDVGGLQSALDTAFGHDGPVLIDIAVDPDAFPPIAGFDKTVGPALAARS